MTGEDLRQLGLTLRDLCESTGATTASLTFGAAVVAYRPERGVWVSSPACGLQVVPDDALDDVGLVPAVTGDVDGLVLAQVEVSDRG